MGTVKRTYALPEEIVTRFEQSVAPRRRSSVLAKVMQQWMAEQERGELTERVVEGCREMADTYLELERDFHLLEEEADREIPIGWEDIRPPSHAAARLVLPD
ncbi:MAG: hypothetical protein HZB26_04180 [Candidatus Hydrogenedentes bacterium]|nr:hypothetical protein [Candidatus Hydrogenedentota bacterium]